MLDP
jgi:hypothetical protein